MLRLRLAVVAVAVSVLLWAAPARTQVRDDPGAPRTAAPLTILQINDIYTTAPVDGVGGLARIAMLKQQIAATGRTPILMLAGDFLSSSVESTVFKGEQMIAGLNAAGLDIATLGNHEFDFGVDLLIQRMSESKFQWVVSNVLDSSTGRPLGNSLPYIVRTFGTLRVGFLGLCLTTEGIGRDKLSRLRLIDPAEAVQTYLPMLRAEKADVIVALTHLSFEEDRALAERFTEIDVIVGGHEHFPITATVNRTLISKAGSDGKFVARIDVNRRPSGVVDRFYELIPVNDKIPDEPRTAAVLKSYADRMDTALNIVVGRTRVPLDGATVRLRASETNLGDMVADAMRANVDADVAIVNAGGIRGDRIIQPGDITRRVAVELHPFGNKVCKIVVTGKTLLDALNSGVSRLPAAAGQFPQVSGLTMRVDPAAAAGSRVSNVRVGNVPLDLARTYTVAVPDFMLLGGDNYTMFEGQKVLVSPEVGDTMVIALEKYLSTGDVAPTVDGRITIVR